MRPNPCIRLSQPNLIDHLKCPVKKTRLSQPNLHIGSVRCPQSQSSIESQDSMPSEATRSTLPSSTFTPPAQRSRYSQPNLPTLLVSYNDGRSTSGSTDRRIRMSQPTLNSSFSGSTFAGIMSKGRLSFPSLRASGDNYSSLKIDEEHLSAPNVHSTRSQHDVTHVLRREPIHKRERLSQPTLVPGDYYPGRGHQRLSQPCLSYERDSQGIFPSGSPSSKHKRFASPPKFTPRDRLHQLDFGSRTRYLNSCRESQQPSSNTIEAVKFNRDRFSIPELETANDLRLIAGTPKQRFSLDSSLGEPKRRSRLLPIASSPISENLGNYDGKKPADGLETVLITSASPLLPLQVEAALEPPTIKQTMPTTARTTPTVLASTGLGQRMSVPDISTSSLRRLLDPPAKQRHSITGNLRQCLLPAIKKQKKDTAASRQFSGDPEPPKNVQRHYSYTYETPGDSPFLVREPMSVMPRKKFLESNFDRNEQVITTVIESEVPIILTSPKTGGEKGRGFPGGTPKWMRKYIMEPPPHQDSEGTKPTRRGSQSSKRKAWQNSKRASVDSAEEEKLLDVRSKDKVLKKESIAVELEANNTLYVEIETNNSEVNEPSETLKEPNWIKTYGLDAEETESDESTSI